MPNGLEIIGSILTYLASYLAVFHFIAWMLVGVSLHGFMVWPAIWAVGFIITLIANFRRTPVE